MGAIAAAVLLSIVVFGPLGWRLRTDWKRARADMTAAEIRSAVNRRLKGESLLSVWVVPKSLWRPGRVVLAAPGGEAWLVGAVWPVVAERVPANYDIVVRLTHPAESRGSREAPSAWDAGGKVKAA